MATYMNKVLALAASLLGTWSGFLFGPLDGLMTALLVFIVTDYLTGVIKAVVQKKLSADVGYKGILKKTAILICVLVGNILDTYVIGMGTMGTSSHAAPCRSIVILFFLSNEGLSILDNAGQIGIPIPEKLKEMIVKLKDS